MWRVPHNQLGEKEVDMTVAHSILDCKFRGLLIFSLVLYVCVADLHNYSTCKTSVLYMSVPINICVNLCIS